jgi:PAB1-binding protein PBP1
LFLGAAGGFRTDTEISGNYSTRERKLERWQPEPNNNVNLSLEDNGTGSWDQFDVNKRLFGVGTNYDENIYTTAIDRSHPEYRIRAERAERLAREIESGGALNAHVAEERGKMTVDDSGIDEEDKCVHGQIQGAHPESLTLVQI